MKIEDNLVTNSKGALFRGGKAAYGFPVVLIVVIFCVVAFIQGAYVIGSIFAIIVVSVFPFILDIRGFQIKIKERQVRIYKWYLGFKYGTWRSLEKFDRIVVDYDSFTIRTADVLSEGSYTYEKNGHFLVTLIAKEGGKEIIATEEFNYPDALEKAKLFSEKTGLELDDVFEEKLRQSKINRAQRRMSRRR